jgi:hypothetical protein
MRNSHAVESSIDIQTQGKSRTPRQRLQPEVLTTLDRDGTNWRATIHAKQRRFAIDEGAHQQMILLRTLERERFILQIRRRPFRAAGTGCRRNAKVNRDQRRA